MEKVLWGCGKGRCLTGYVRGRPPPVVLDKLEGPASVTTSPTHTSCGHQLRIGHVDHILAGQA